jgi:amidase
MSIWELPAREIARGIRTRAFSAEETVVASLERIAQTNPAVNAVVEVHDEDARRRAREADDLVRRGEAVGELHGVPITFKMNTNVVGLPTTDGVAAYADNIAMQSDPQVTSLLAAGAVPVGRTNCPSFSTRWTTENDFHGVTRNPWDPAVTPGGSSGGAAAAVAAGMCAIAQGNDTAGSVRYPAACCGVAGIRPTKGRLPAWSGAHDHDPPMVVQEFVVQGPLARRVDDLRLGLSAMSTRDARDPTAVPFTAVDPAAGPVPVAVVTDPGGPGLSGSSTTDAVAATRAAAEWLGDAGYAVEEVELPALGEAARVWWKLALTEVKIGLLPEVQRVGDEGTRRFFGLMFQVYEQEFGEVDLPGFIVGYHRRAGLRRELSEFMERYPLILTPVSGEAPFPMGDDVISVERTAELMAHGWPGMSVPVLGLPCLGLPATRGDGAPMGVQLIGRPFDEETVLRAGEVIEARSGIVTPIDPVTS